MKQTLLTEEQQEAIHAQASVAVIAGAGSGKTKVLIERSARLLREEKIPLDRLLVMTFTEKAAGELKERLRPFLDAKQLPFLERAWFGTFHSFCARILRLHAPLLKCDPSFHILDENRARLLVRHTLDETLLDLLHRGNQSVAHLLERLEYRNTTGLLEELMDFRWHAHAQLQNDRDEFSQDLFFVFQHVERAFRKKLFETGNLDFQELERLTLELFQRDEQLLRDYQKKFLHLLVDEYQDTNDLQTMLVSLLFHPPGNQLFIVGDPRQSIYRFRGANVASFSTMIEQIRKNKGKVIALTHNFRTRPHILDLINTTAKPLEEKLPLAGITLKAARDEKELTDITVLRCSSDTSAIHDLRTEEAEQISKHIQKLVQNEQASYGKIACLFQALTSIDIYEAAFERYNIPYRIHGGRRFLNQPEVQDLLCALSFAANPKNDSALIGLLRSPFIGLSDDELVLLAGKNGKDFRQSAMRSPKAAPLLEKLITAAHVIAPSEIIALLLQHTGYEWICGELDTSGKKQAHIEHFLTLLHNLEEESFFSLTDCVEHIRNLKVREARLGDPPSSANSNNVVHCMTVHAAKGLEFPIVILPDLVRRPATSSQAWCFLRHQGLGVKERDQNTPLGPLVASPRYEELRKQDRHEEEEESRRLLYVAMTRAQEKLILPLHTREGIRGEWHAWILSALHNLPATTIEKNKEEMKPSRGIHQQQSHDMFHLPQKRLQPSQEIKIITVSELELLDRSREEYVNRYLLGRSLDAPSFAPHELSPSLRGVVLHEALEILARSNSFSPEQALEGAFQTHHLLKTPQLLETLLPLLERFLKTPIGSSLSEGDHELRFDWKRNNVILTGKVDWLRSHHDGYEIIDFKTDSSGTPQELETHYELQMGIYALALEEGLQKPIFHTTLAFLEHGETMTTPMTMKRKKELRTRIDTLLQALLATHAQYYSA